jgi:hypothetical protein
MVAFYTNGIGVDNATLVATGPNTASATSLTELAGGFNFGLNQITAVYGGDTTYQESISSPITLTVAAAGTTPDFTLALQAAQLAVAAGGSANTSINLASEYGFNGTVNLSCTTSAANIGCTVSPTAVNVNGPTQVTLTVTAASGSAQTAMNPPISGRPIPWLAIGLSVIGCCFLAGPSKTKRMRYLPVSAAMFALVVFWAGCGGGQSSTPVPQPQPPPPLNTFSVVVTATNATNGSIHNAKLTVVVH